MKLLNIDNLTAAQLLNKYESVQVAQDLTLQLARAAFVDADTGKVNLKADPASKLIEVLTLAKTERTRHNNKVAKDAEKEIGIPGKLPKGPAREAMQKAVAAFKKARQYNAVNVIQTQLNRTGLAPEGKYFSLITTGDKVEANIISKKSKPAAKGAKAKGAKGKGGKEQALKAFANLREALEALEKCYTFDAIKAEVAKMAADRKAK